MTWDLGKVIRGIGGEPEVTRLVGFVGGFAYIIGAHVFIAWELVMGRGFDLTTYCLTFPAGLAAVAGGTAAAARWKDQGVASAKITEQNRALPSKQPAGVQEVKVTNTEADPLPVDQQ